MTIHTQPLNARAFVATQHGDEVACEIRDVPLADLGEGDVSVRVSWSSVNYKDGLATVAGGKVARLTQLVPGIDLAGTVLDPGGSGLAAGDPVLVHGHGLGVSHHGGYAQYARVPAAWVVPLPPALSPREAMILGTAGFTAALSVHQLEARGLRPQDGPVLVTGASGGVGSVAVAVLAQRGYDVVASSGRAGAAGYLGALGAREVIDRAETCEAGRPLDRERWAGAVDCVGGSTLAYVLSTLRHGAAVAASGNTGGGALTATVFPFILRGAALLGVDSVECPIGLRREIWSRLADGEDLRPAALQDLCAGEVDLDGLRAALDGIRSGQSRGRTLVRVLHDDHPA